MAPRPKRPRHAGLLFALPLPIAVFLLGLNTRWSAEDASSAGPERSLRPSSAMVEVNAARLVGTDDIHTDGATVSQALPHLSARTTLGRWADLSVVDTIVVYGPRSFATENGSSQLHIERFRLDLIEGAQYTIEVEFGSTDGAPRPTGASLRFNGSQVIDPSDVAIGKTVKREVEADTINTLEVTVEGPPNASVTVTLFRDPLSEFTVFEERFSSGVIESREFSVSSTATPPYRFYAEQERERWGAGTGSIAWLNGTQVLSEADFEADGGPVVRQVELEPENSLQIEVLRESVKIRITATDVTPPSLEIMAPLPDATVAAAEVTVAGRVDDETPVQVTVGGTLTPVSDGGFEVSIPLPKEGPNTIEIVAIDAAGHRVVETITVNRDTAGPLLEIDSPENGMVTIEASVPVAGRTEPGASVTLNGLPVATDPGGHFTTDLPLALGSNLLTFLAQDELGHMTIETREVVRAGDPRTDLLSLASTEPASGYIAWFKADAITGLSDGDSVSTWEDLGPNSKHATQSVDSLKPVYKTDVIAGKPVVRFDGINDRLQSPAQSGIWGLTNHFTVFAVVRLDSAPGSGNHDVVGSNNLANNLDLIARRNDANGNWVAVNTTQDGTHNSDLVLSTGTWHLLTWRLKATSPKHLQIRADTLYRLNDTSYTGIGTAPSTAALGARQNGANPFKGDIAEIVFYTASISDADMKTTEEYLIAKYGLDFSPPGPDAPSDLAVTAAGPDQIDLEWTDNSADEDGFRIERRIGESGTFRPLLHVAADVETYSDATVADDTEYCYRVIAFNAEGDSEPSNIDCDATQELDLPPDPAFVAPAIDPSTVTLLSNAVEFLFAGPDSIQTGVAPGAIEVRQATGVRGRVLAESGSPLSGVQVSIQGRPEFGRTLSRADGVYDLVVNGGGPLTLAYHKPGRVGSQRTVNLPWQDWVVLEDVTLLEPDSLATVIRFAELMEVARGTSRTDADGTRQPTLLFPINADPELVMPDDSTQSISTLTVRATEFTVGEGGLSAMPAGLPPTSAYTFAADVRIEEAEAAGAVGVQFSQPVLFYIENFLGFPVGTPIPLGRYDSQRSQWIPEENGLVVELVGVTDGLAELDLDGDGNAENATALALVGIYQPERVTLAELYATNTELWRMPLAHLSYIDGNLPYGATPGSGDSDRGTGGNAGDAGDPEPQGKPKPKPCKETRSIIECQNQILGERIPIVGTPFTLNYRSDRTRGYEIGYSLHIPLTIDSVPADLQRIELEIEVAGRTFADTFPAAPNQSTTFTWDGLDAYGRELQGAQPVRVRIRFVYPFYYGVPANVARSFGLTCTDPPGGSLAACIIPTSLNSDARQEAVLDYLWAGMIGTWRATAVGLGGWTLSPHHAYDPYSRTIHYGDGTRRLESVSGIRIVTHIAGKPQGTSGDGGPATEALFWDIPSIAVAPDGSYYLSDKRSQVVRRVGTDGIIQRYAGKILDDGFSGDGGPATDAQLDEPRGIALGPDGTLYIVDSDNFRIRAVAPDGTITTLAGTGTEGSSGDGGPATAADIDPWDVAAGPDGSVYISENSRHRIRRVGLDGIITTVAGTGSSGGSGDGGLAVAAKLFFPRGIDVGPDGSLYIADYANHRIRRVSLGGVITTVAGATTATGGFSGDGGPAVDALLKFPVEATLDGAGRLYIGDEANRRVRIVDVDGVISTFAGSGNGADGNPDYSGDGGPATAAKLSWPRGLDIGPDGALYMTDDLKRRVRKVSRLLSGVTSEAFQFASEDGSEVYGFDAAGRHLTTRHGLTGAILYSFAYEGQGRLASITDGAGNVTTIERDSLGVPTTIEGAFGQRTELTLDANGYLETVTNPASEVITLDHDAQGLLTAYTDAREHISTFTYDATGRLIEDADAAGGSIDLDRTDFGTSFEVAKTTALNRTTTYLTEDLPAGGERRENIDPSGLAIETVLGTDGTTSITHPDGTVVTLQEDADPRFDLQAPIVAEASVATPGGLTAIFSTSRSDSLTNRNDPFTLVSQVDSLLVNGRLFLTTYAAAQRTFATTTPEGRQRFVQIDSLAQVVWDSTGGLLAVRYSYDTAGRLSQITQGDRLWSYAYDTGGRLVRMTDPLGRKDSLVYDAADRVVRQILPDITAIELDYDANGNVIGVTPPGRPEHQFGYTPVDLMASYTPPDLAGLDVEATTYAYNLDRQLTRITRPDSLVIDFGYDSGGRLSTVTIPGGQLGYGYSSSSGKLTGIKGPYADSLSFSYDGSLLTGMTWSGSVGGSVAAVYDNDFRVIATKVNGADSIAFGYDDDGLLVQAGALSLNRHPSHGLVTATTLGSVTTTHAYNGFGEPSEYVAQYADSELFHTTYARDSLGRITQLTEMVLGTTTTFNYGYDPVGRLVEVKTNSVVTATYEYDDNGNRTQATTSGGTVTGTYDDQDRLLSYGSASYAYTPNGELARKIVGTDTTLYSYDVLGNLTFVELPDGTEIEYLIDGLNRRVGKKVNGSLVQGWLYEDQLNPVAELDSLGQIVARFIYGSRPNVPDYVIKSGILYRIVTDHLGTVRLVVNVSTGAVAQRLDFNSSGQITLDTNPGFQPFGFTGGLLDTQQGLTRFGVRDYDPEVGRWVSKDPVLFAGGSSNFYSYALGDPVNLIDPWGLCPPHITGRPCTPGGVTYRPGVQVSNPTIRDGLELIARQTNSHVIVHSGDRRYNPKGSSNSSPHRTDRGGQGAADFHLFDDCGKQIPDKDAVDSIFDSGGVLPGLRLIHHGPNTKTTGEHLHLDTRIHLGHRYEEYGRFPLLRP